MNKLNNIKRGIMELIMCLSLSLCSCGSDYHGENADNTATADVQQDENASSVVIDYGDAESFESALNKGENLEGKVVQFVASEFHPDSKLGYNVWSGEHLNFVSSRNPDIKEGDTVTVRTVTIENVLGSWVINYEKVDNAVVGEDTITYDKIEKTTTVKTTPKPETAITTTKKTESTDINTEKTTTDATPEINGESTYEHNAYYDIVETATFINSIGNTIVIHKVLAKQNVFVSASLLAYGADGNVLGKGSDEITLTEGQYNYFRYYFDGDITNADVQPNFNAKSDSFLTGERNAVEMVQYNQSEDHLYITFRQNVDELDYFAKFKILFYCGDQIVDSDYGYFNTYAENLNGKDTTDVAQIWTYGINYDRIEYIFEP